MAEDKRARAPRANAKIVVAETSAGVRDAR